MSVHYFRLMKELALLGYFTSEIGYRQAQMRYVETPGRYGPCAPRLDSEARGADAHSRARATRSTSAASALGGAAGFGDDGLGCFRAVRRRFTHERGPNHDGKDKRPELLRKFTTVQRRPRH